jgi:proteasome accessory factor B
MPYRKLTHSLLERMRYIDACIRAGKQVNCTTVGKHFDGLSRDAVLEAIDDMRDRQGLPIDFDPRRNSYYYTEPVESTPGWVTSEGEVFAMLVARAALEQYRGTTYPKQLEVSLKKLSAGLTDKVSFSFEDPLQPVSFQAMGRARIDPDVFGILMRARNLCVEVEFDYRKPGDDKAGPRVVRPYHLAWRNNLCYLVGFDYKRAKEITFAVPRVTRPVLTRRKFKVPASFSPEKHFAKALSAMGGDGDYRIVIRFRGATADRVREREWHESEKLRDLPDGGLELELRLGALEEIERWVLMWGPEAEVIEPMELRERVIRTIAELAKMYSK